MKMANNFNELSPEEQEIVQMYRDGFRAIWWSVDDFESRAQILEDIYVGRKYNREDFQYSLEEMLHHHDANNGITWDTIDEYLDYYCLIQKEDE